MGYRIHHLIRIHHVIAERVGGVWRLRLMVRLLGRAVLGGRVILRGKDGLRDGAC